MCPRFDSGRYHKTAPQVAKLAGLFVWSLRSFRHSSFRHWLRYWVTCQTKSGANDEMTSMTNDEMTPKSLPHHEGLREAFEPQFSRRCARLLAVGEGAEQHPLHPLLRHRHCAQGAHIP